jgi:hypothetical protein
VGVTKSQVLQRNAFKNQNVSLKDKKGVNDLMHVSLKQDQIQMAFDTYKLLLLYDNNHYIYIYILKYVVKEINLLFFKCLQMFHRKFKGKHRTSDSLPSS